MNPSAEDKIKAAALQVFLQKGYANCTSREIAREAGMNVALVNYYFRSKSKLFAIVFESVMNDFMHSMVQVFSSDLPVRSKIELLIAREYEFLALHPEIPNFVLSEIERNPNSMDEIKPMLSVILKSGVLEEVELLQKKGEMRSIDMVSITLLLMSNCQFPFMAKKLVHAIHGIELSAYENQLQNHREHVVQMILNYLFPNDAHG
jgi:AcrR family transcriptional regulator